MEQPPLPFTRYTLDYVRANFMPLSNALGRDDEKNVELGTRIAAGLEIDLIKAKLKYKPLPEYELHTASGAYDAPMEPEAVANYVEQYLLGAGNNEEDPGISTETEDALVDLNWEEYMNGKNIDGIVLTSMLYALNGGNFERDTMDMATHMFAARDNETFYERYLQVFPMYYRDTLDASRMIEEINEKIQGMRERRAAGLLGYS